MTNFFVTNIAPKNCFSDENFVTKTFFKKIQAHIATKIFVTKTISYKILLHLVTKYFVIKTIFCCYICDKKIRR